MAGKCATEWSRKGVADVCMTNDSGLRQERG